MKNNCFFLIIILIISNDILLCVARAPPIQQYTTITLYTDRKPWNEAQQVCTSSGGHMLDMTYYSILMYILDASHKKSWTELGILSDPTWLGLHRRITMLGDYFYSSQCEPLNDYQVAIWGTAVGSWDIMDGPTNTFCVYDVIHTELINKKNTNFHDFTRADCTEQHMFLCQYENGVCEFEQIRNVKGNTLDDFSPYNDIVIPYVSLGACASRCLAERTDFPYTKFKVVEECWAFTVTGPACTIHMVLQPTYFDDVTKNGKVAFPSANLYIKRCFNANSNTSVIDTIPDLSPETNSTCGVPVTGNSSMMSRNVTFYGSKWTWNEAFLTCQENGQQLLIIEDDKTYYNLQKMINKYNRSNTITNLWLGLHEPDPISYPDVRVWSNCEGVVSSNWDTAYPPSTSVTNDSLCVVVDKGTLLWTTVQCTDTNLFVCVGDQVTTWTYENGIVDTVGSTVGTGVTLGPYNVTVDICKDMCSTWTHDNQECWAFAFMIVKPEVLHCRLYFAPNHTHYDTQTETADGYTFYRKMLWSTTFIEKVNIAPNSAIFPYSCCDVSTVTSECPSNILPTHDTATTVMKELRLFKAEVTWNEAKSVCVFSGGRLLEIDNIPKRNMLQRYLNKWKETELITGQLWMGLVNINTHDPCSLHWVSSCTKLKWHNFIDESYRLVNTKYCVALDPFMQYHKRNCTTKLPFVCELDIGVCAMDDVVSSINCVLEPNGEVHYVPAITDCNAVCLDMILNGKECWASKIAPSGACTLYFYSDPHYCKDNNSYKKSDSVTFKNCFIDTVSSSAIRIAVDTRLEPNITCPLPFVFPHVLDGTICNVSVNATSSISPTSSTASTIQTNTATSGTLATVPATITTTILSASQSIVASTTSLSMSSSISTTSPNTNSVITLSTTTPKAKKVMKPIYIRPCLCYKQNITNKLTLIEWTDWISKELIMNKQVTSRYRRGLTSALDTRSSTVQMGVVAIVIMVGLIIYLVAMDISTIRTNYMYVHGRHDPAKIYRKKIRLKRIR